MALMRFLVIGFVAAVLVACGDDDSSFATRPSGDSSSACEDCDDLNSSSAKSSSSKDVTSKSSDSETSVFSSSSAKSSSSEKKTGSSSSTKSSSSSSVDSSSSSAKSSSSVVYVEPCRTDSVDTCEYGTLTDERDGQTYKTVKIGTQTWMAENLSYAYTGVPYKYTYKDSSYTSDSTSWCYRDSVEYCTKYGRLYTWAAAMDSVGTWSTNGKGCGYDKTCTPTYPVRGVCPEGWRLPTKAEFETLFTAVGGSSTAAKMLKSTSGWNRSGNGTDAYAFSALPAGLKYYDGDSYNEGLSAYFWSSSERSSIIAYGMYLDYSYDSADLSTHSKFNGYSVRCVQDSE